MQTSFTIDSVRAPDAAIVRHRREGAWRTGSFLDDLWTWRDRTPDAPAIVAYRSGGERVRLSYAEYADRVDRFAAGLAGLGAGPGTVVALQLPNWWEANALLLAAFRVGAVVAPLVPTLSARETERILHRVGAAICVIPDEWDGTDYAARLAEMAPRLPRLRHRVVLGEPRRPGEVGFTDHFVRPNRRPKPSEAGADPDRAAVVLFTSGTTGAPKGAVHSLNTVYALAAEYVRVWRFGPADSFYTPHWSLHLAGMVTGGIYALLAGGTAVLTDAWAPGTAATVLATEAVTYLGAAPVFLTALMAELRLRGRTLPSLRTVCTFGTTVPPQLVTEVAETLGVTLGTAWGMTEAGYLFTRPDDPAGWAARSIGRPNTGTEIQLRTMEDQLGHLVIRGAGVCLATLDRDRDTIDLVGGDWYETGDLAVPDGRGGVRLMGRLADRIGDGFMVPATDVEAALRGHPAVSDVALVGVPGPGGVEQVCAVIVPDGKPPELDELRAYLTGLGMTEWYQPTRSVIRMHLPYNASGKVNKAVLRADVTTG
ncbi:AMP-binding protein [Actinoplanes sp. TBRC 11911]|uniref:AMP-binding protein n=1 Tax=Actinoplanes sp. TBRC 11911 TaxID=2729386 RepID=UPI00145D935F|nr:AMP-binding protein [Actinoplanes sp. TBRC 11911]NMO49720.1 AMP-binding protein [Actinoplanes sp. TBRC 11911]